MISRIFAWVFAAFLAVLYVYSLVTSVGDIIGMREMSAVINQPISGVGWVLLCVGVLLPVVIAAAALWIGRKKTAWVRVLLLAAGFCALAAIDLEITHLINLSSSFNENIFFSRAA